MSSNPFDVLIRDIVRPEPENARTRWSFLAGTVSAVTPGQPPTVDVSLNGSPVPGLRFPAGTSPQVGDTVWVAVKGTSAMFVAFVLAS